jgi:hypothetical protein
MMLADHPKVLAIRRNPDLLKTIWEATAPNLGDLRVYLVSGQSPKFDPIKILGRWRFDVGSAVAAMRRAKPNMPSSEMQRIRKYMETAYNKTTCVARPDNQIALRNVPSLQAPAAGAPPAGQQTLQGQWKDVDGKYQLNLSGQELMATVEADRLKIATPAMDLVFNRED